MITAEGLFDGVIRDGDEEFFIEPAHRYFPAQHLGQKERKDNGGGGGFEELEKSHWSNMNETSGGTAYYTPVFHSVIYKVR